MDLETKWGHIEGDQGYVPISGRACWPGFKVEDKISDGEVGDIAGGTIRSDMVTADAIVEAYLV